MNECLDEIRFALIWTVGKVLGRHLLSCRVPRITDQGFMMNGDRTDSV